MKTLITVCFLLSLNLYSQESLSDIESQDFPPEENVYYLDTNNLLDPFVGNYLYTNGNESFEVILMKKVHSSNNDFYYEDLIVGGYKYISNGVDVINTLNALSLDFSDGKKNDIYANNILRGPRFGQDDIQQGEIWLNGVIKDPTNNRSLPLFIKMKTINNQEAIEITLLPPHTTMRLESEPEPQAFALPFTESFTLIKQ